MTPEKKGVEVTYNSLVVVWAALLASQLIFFLVIYLGKPELFPPTFSAPFFGDQPLIVGVFILMAATFLILSFVFRNQHMRRAVVDQDAGCVQTGLMLGCALSEACSLLGVVLAFAFDYPYFYLWIALGLLGVLFHFPRRGNLEAATYKRLK